MAIQNITPNGFCKCGRPLMEVTEDGVKRKICPVHSVKTGPPSGLVNTIPIPPASEFTVDGPTPTVNDDKIDAPMQKVIPPVTNQLKVNLGLLGNALGLDDSLACSLTEAQMVMLYDYIAELPNPTTLKEAKSLIRLQDTIDALLGRV